MLAQSLLEYSMIEPILLAIEPLGYWAGSFFFGPWTVSKLVITGVIGLCIWFLVSRPK